MTTLKEKKILVRMQKAMGEPVDEKLLEEIASEEAKLQTISESRKSAFQTIFADLSKDIGKLIADEKQKTIEEEQLLSRFANVLTKIDEIKETQPEAISIIEPVVEEVIVEKSAILAPPETPSLAVIAAKQIKAEAPPSMFVQPEPPLVSRDIKDIQGKLKMLEGWVSKIAMAGPGGGEVNLRYLDDVARNTISDGLYLRYNEPTKKFIFDRGHYNNFYGAFQSTVTQNCGASTATALTYNQVDFSYGVTVTDNSRVVLEYPGLYNAQFSVQLTNSGTQIDRVYIWLRQNGQDVIGSAGKIDVPSSHGGAPGAILIGWNFYVNTTAPNEYFEFMWFTPDEVHVTIPTLPAQIAVNNISPAIPSTASVVLTVSPVKINV